MVLWVKDMEMVPVVARLGGDAGKEGKEEIEDDDDDEDDDGLW